MPTLKIYATGSAEPEALSKGSLRLYGNRFCPYVYRVRLVLAAKDIPHEVVNIHLMSKPEWYLLKNPEGKVPAIEFDDNVLYESLIIANYLDSAFPKDKLWSNDILEVAKGRIIIERTAKLSAINQKAFYGEPQLDEIFVELEYYEKALKTIDKPYFSGASPGMVDYMVYPFLEMSINLYGSQLESEGKSILSKAKRPHLTSWIEKMKSDSAVLKAGIPSEIWKQFMASLKAEKVDFDVGLTD